MEEKCLTSTWANQSDISILSATELIIQGPDIHILLVDSHIFPSSYNANQRGLLIQSQIYIYIFHSHHRANYKCWSIPILPPLNQSPHGSKPNAISKRTLGEDTLLPPQWRVIGRFDNLVVSSRGIAAVEGAGTSCRHSLTQSVGAGRSRDRPEYEGWEFDMAVRRAMYEPIISHRAADRTERAFFHSWKLKSRLTTCYLTWL